MNYYLIKYKHGLMNSFYTYAENENEAKKYGLAEYRRNQTMVVFNPIEDVIDSVELVNS